LSIGRALAEQQDGHQVARLAAAQGLDPRVVGRPLDAAVPAQVVVAAVAVVLAVGRVVLAVVGDQVIARVKPSWQVTKLMLLIRRSAQAAVEIAAAGQAGRDLVDQPRVAPHEGADVVAERPFHSFQK
jgi:hypothetical protein